MSINYPLFNSGYSFNGISLNTGSPCIWGRLYPYTGATSWGGKTQLEVQNPDVNPQVALMANNMCLPGGLGNSSSIFTPMTDDQKKDLQDTYSRTFEGIRISCIINKIQELEGQVDSELKNNDKLTDAQKSQLQTKLDELKQLEQDAKNLTNNINDKNNSLDSVDKSISDLTGKYEDAKTAVTKLAEDIANNSDENTGKGDAADGKKDDKTDGTDGADGTDKSKKDDQADEDEQDEGIPESAKLNKKGKLALDYQLTDICGSINKAIKDFGTNYEKLLELFDPSIQSKDGNKIDSSNIIEIFDKWNEVYAKLGDNADDKGGLIESLMDDCEGSQKEEIGTFIVNALEKRANEEGIDITEKLGAAREALSGTRHWYTCYANVRDDDDICNAINAIVTAIKNEENTNITNRDNKKTEDENATKKAEEDAKAKAEKDKQETIDKAEATFLKDIQDCNHDTTRVMPKDVEVWEENGEFKGFQIRIEGITYQGKDYLDLKKQVEAGGKTFPIE